jgi:hypothetical protein
LEVAEATSAPKVVVNALHTKADEAWKRFDAHESPNADHPEEMLRSYAALKRLAAKLPDGYSAS